MNVVWAIASTFIKMLYGVLIYKFISVNYGIEHLGSTGQLLSLMSILMILSNAGINRGVIQTYARHKKDSEKIESLNAASTIIQLSSGILLFILLSIFAKQISFLIFNTDEYSYLIYFLAFLQFLMGLNNNISSIGIAYEESKLVSKATLLAFSSALVIAYIFGKPNFQYLLIIIAAQSLFLFLFLFSFNYKLFFKHIKLSFKRCYIFPEVKSFLGFSFVIILPVLMIQASLIVNRINIESGFGKLNLGLWEAAIKLQEGYIQIVAILLIYFLIPKASESFEKAYATAKQFIIRTFLLFTFAVIFTAFLGEVILTVVYNEQTSIMANNLLILTISDALRSIFIVNQYLLLAILKIKTFLVLEVTAYLSSVLFVWYVSNYSIFDNLFYGYLIQSICLSLFSLFLVSLSKKNV